MNRWPKMTTPSLYSSTIHYNSSTVQHQRLKMATLVTQRYTYYNNPTNTDYILLLYTVVPGNIIVYQRSYGRHPTQHWSYTFTINYNTIIHDDDEGEILHVQQSIPTPTTTRTTSDSGFRQQEVVPHWAFPANRKSSHTGYFPPTRSCPTLDISNFPPNHPKVNNNNDRWLHWTSNVI